MCHPKSAATLCPCLHLCLMDSVQKGESLEREHPGRAHRSVGPWWCLVGIMLQSGQIPSVDWEWRGPQSEASGQVHPPLWLLVSLWGKEMCGINRGTREEGGCVKGHPHVTDITKN